jgi:hypothetical protein
MPQFFFVLAIFKHPVYVYRVIINDCPIAVSVGEIVECVASLIT